MPLTSLATLGSMASVGASAARTVLAATDAKSLSTVARRVDSGAGTGTWSRPSPSDPIVVKPTNGAAWENTSASRLSTVSLIICTSAILLPTSLNV